MERTAAPPPLRETHAFNVLFARVAPVTRGEKSPVSDPNEHPVSHTPSDRQDVVLEASSEPRWSQHISMTTGVHPLSAPLNSWGEWRGGGGGASVVLILCSCLFFFDCSCSFFAWVYSLGLVSPNTDDLHRLLKTAQHNQTTSYSVH